MGGQGSPVRVRASRPLVFDSYFPCLLPHPAYYALKYAQEPSSLCQANGLGGKKK